MFTFKPKKVFDKLNKMDRKQAYTIGAVVAVSVVALLMLVSASTSGDESFEGFSSRGYDLADMKFATDEAEQFLLANRYPDMQENGSTLLYSKQEKEERQAADEAAAQAEEWNETSPAQDDFSSQPGYTGYSGAGQGGRGRGRTPTEINRLNSANMASAGGSGVNSTWGPTGDFRQFKGREDRGMGPNTPLAIARKREAAAFRTASLQANKSDKKLQAVGKSVQQLSVDGQNPTTTGPTVDPTGGFQIGDGELPSTTDLDNVDKAVDDAAQKAQDKPKDPDKKTSWWEEMLQGLAKQAAGAVVDSLIGGLEDTIRGNIAARKARNRVYRADSNQQYANLTDDDIRAFAAANKIDSSIQTVADFKKAYSPKSYYKTFGKEYAQKNTAVSEQADQAADIAIGQARDRFDNQRFIKYKYENSGSSATSTPAEICQQRGKTYDSSTGGCK